MSCSPRHARVVGWQVAFPWRDYQAQVFGARLKPAPELLCSASFAVLPVSMVYGVSVSVRDPRPLDRKLVRVRVEKALESGLHIGRSPSTRCSLISGTRRAAWPSNCRTSRKPPGSALLRLREEKGVQSAALFSVRRSFAGRARDRTGQRAARSAQPGPTQAGAQHACGEHGGSGRRPALPARPRAGFGA